ncbi:DUF695 domain-containing protein [bacterium]|nr:DUF695 domain-containing protein [bacterium]MBU1989624.1 DUF695 domain-containing protein [bacterium]
MREVFQREEETLVNIETVMDAEDFQSTNPWLFSVFIKYDANVLNEDYYEFLETKESLIISLEHNKYAKYAGSRTVDGWTELYFYAKDSKQLDLTVAKFLGESGYVFESNVVRDTKWDFYKAQLLPSDLEAHHIQSAKIIFLLAEEGDTLIHPREVEHYIVFDTPTQKDRFIESVQELGFAFKDDLSTEDFEHGVAVVKTSNVTYDEVKKMVEELLVLVKNQKAYYEGWSTVLVLEEDTI